MKSLILLELNEINFDAVKYYISTGLKLPAFEEIMAGNFITTVSEEKYELLEPWIQWPSIHTGKSYSEHKIFRLGDFISSSEEQIFEKIESKGYDVGVISAMNASNKLSQPAYFIPDPWIATSPDDSFFSRSLHRAISQAVNDNSQSRITWTSLFTLAIAFLSFVKPKNFLKFAKYAISARGKSWRKALFLDMFLAEIHSTYFVRKKPHFTTLFLNAGAHIQHHYFLNSKCYKNEQLKNPSWYIDESIDPFEEMLIVYDKILQNFLSKNHCELILATGLSQVPHKNVTFYYRLKNHSLFLDHLGLNYTNVMPRMTRDFLITFADEVKAKAGEEILKNVYLNDKSLFGEIDNRGTDLFVVLTYDEEITSQCIVEISGRKIALSDFVTFVAIKNGEHNGKGYAYYSEGLCHLTPPDKSNITKLHDSIIDYFQ